LHSHYGINFCSRIKDAKTLTVLLLDANKREIEKDLWQQWLVDYSRMSSETFMTFEKYKDNFLNENIVTKKTDIVKVLADAKVIMAVDKAEREKLIK